MRKQLRKYGIDKRNPTLGTTYYQRQGGVIFAIHKSFTLDLIVHEVAHARQAVLCAVGLYDNELSSADPWRNSALAETEAYLEGFLFARIMEELEYQKKQLDTVR